MNARRLTFIVLLFSWIGDIRAECAGPLILEDSFAYNGTVFVGRAIAQEIVSRTGARDGTWATETTFEVEELWKGQTNTTLRVQNCGWHDGNEAMTCSEDFTFVVGFRYVVFAAGDPLQTNSCGPTALVDRAAKTLQWLFDKPRKSPVK